MNERSRRLTRATTRSSDSISWTEGHGLTKLLAHADIKYHDFLRR